MRIAVIGATGNIGWPLLARLAANDRVREVVAVARRAPVQLPARTRFFAADVAVDDLAPAVAGVDAVVHLAWALLPSHDPDTLWRINVDGTRRSVEAAAEAGASAMVVASAAGAYAAAPKEPRVDESWPATGIPTAMFARHKAAVEATLDVFEARHPQLRVVRIRPSAVFSREAASAQRRLFASPFLASWMLRTPVAPVLPDLRFQAIHSTDVARAIELALFSETARGAFNLAGEPVITAREIASAMRARTVAVPPRLARLSLALAFHARISPSEAAWLDIAAGTPLLDTTRAVRELSFTPAVDARVAIRELITGLREGAQGDTPALQTARGLRRLRELADASRARSRRPRTARQPGVKEASGELIVLDEPE